MIFAAACGSSAENQSNSAEAKTENLQVQTALSKVQNIPTYFEATGSLAGDASSGCRADSRRENRACKF